MKSFFAICLSLLLCFEGTAQGLDQSIGRIAEELAQKVARKNKPRLAIADFVNSEGKVDPLTEYIRQELELKLINAAELQVMDRKHMTRLLEEHHLQSQGLINESVVKSAIAFIKIDGLVLAEITYLGGQIKIKVTVTDVTTSLMYAASASDLISDPAIKNLLDPDIKVCPECGGKGTVQEQAVCKTCSGGGGITCSRCRGTGKGEGLSSAINCDVCNGRGKLNCTACNSTGKNVFYKTCPKCNGKVQLKDGSVPGTSRNGKAAKVEICPICVGEGKIRDSRKCSGCVGTGRLVIRGSITTCPTCKGTTSETYFDPCAKCNGTGKL
jgi:DnaJ-class molecular chaperone